jgi:murein DD-endopeptidase MepM/ murein hydrolase activator NlpD
MAVSLIAGLVRTAGSQVAKKGVKRIAVKKAKSLIKDKDKVSNKKTDKLSKKSELISSEENKIGQRSSISKGGGEAILSSTGTSGKLTIKEAPDSKSQSEQLKINVTNIHKFLVKSNNQYTKTESQNKKLRKRQESKRKLGREEKTLEKRTSPIGKSAKNIKNVIASSGSIFDKLFEFIGLIVAGIIVNALPAIISKVREIIDNIVNFLTPIQSGFNLIMGFFTGEIDENKFDADKKRLDDSLENMNREDGIIDTIAKKVGPFGGLVKLLKPAINSMRNAIGGKKKVLARKDGKEGVLDTETDIFTERQFTSKERRRLDNQEGGGGGGEPPVNTPNNTTTTKLKPGHYYFPLPKGRFAGASAQYYGAGRDYGGHAGIDLTEKPPFGSKPNIDVVALAGGTVIGDKYLAGKEYMSGMMVKGNDGYDQRYLHMTPMLSIGDSVKAGQKIGELVDLGLVPGYKTNDTHLHFEVYNRGKTGHLSPHKIYPRFFKDPNTADRSFDNRANASGGNRIVPVKRNENIDKISNSGMSENTSTYYYIQPVDTVQYQVVPFPVPMKKNLNTSTEQSELNPIWTK